MGGSSKARYSEWVELGAGLFMLDRGFDVIGGAEIVAAIMESLAWTMSSWIVVRVLGCSDAPR